jgi:hypothetical protein
MSGNYSNLFGFTSRAASSWRTPPSQPVRLRRQGRECAPSKNDDSEAPQLGGAYVGYMREGACRTRESSGGREGYELH